MTHQDNDLSHNIEQDQEVTTNDPRIDHDLIGRLVSAVPKLYSLIYKRSLDGSGGRANAIKAKCYECVGFEDVGNRVGGCKTKRCPLWLYRPRQ